MYAFFIYTCLVSIPSFNFFFSHVVVLETARGPPLTLAEAKRQAKLKGEAASETKGGVAFEVDMTPPPKQPGVACVRACA